MKMGKFVTFEGCEGAGKSTQIKMLEKYLREKNINYVLTREPGGSAIAESIRSIILDSKNLNMSYTCEAFLYSAARAQHIQDIVAPALALGKLVICDRYIDSSFAYQGYARGLGIDFIGKLNNLTIGDYVPDLTLFLDIRPKDAFERKGGADKNDRLELMDINFHEKVYEGYKLIAKENPMRFIGIDASGSKFNTHDNIIKTLKVKRII